MALNFSPKINKLIVRCYLNSWPVWLNSLGSVYKNAWNYNNNMKVGTLSISIIFLCRNKSIYLSIITILIFFVRFFLRLINLKRHIMHQKSMFSKVCKISNMCCVRKKLVNDVLKNWKASYKKYSVECSKQTPSFGVLIKAQWYRSKDAVATQ
jgi:hypothetical protein